MNNKVGVNQLMALFVSGAMAGIVSLIVSSVFYFFIIKNTVGSIVLVAVIEETVKLAIIWIVLDLLNIDLGRLKMLRIIGAGIALGLGFGLFEWLLVVLKGDELTIAALAPVVIHVVSSWFILIGVKFFIRNRTFRPMVAFWILAVSFHLFYNLVVI